MMEKREESGELTTTTNTTTNTTNTTTTTNTNTTNTTTTNSTTTNSTTTTTSKEMKRKGIVFGSSGAVGKEVVKELLHSTHWSHIVSFGRRECTFHLQQDNGSKESQQSDKLQQKIGNFEDEQQLLEAIRGNDAVFCCLGTTIKKAGSQSAFRKVDHDYVIAIANAAHHEGVEEFYLCSSIGADSKSNNFYLKTKGETEDKLKSIGFRKLGIFNPSLLIASREETRIGESIARAVMRPVGVLFFGGLQKYKSIKVEHVAKAMRLFAESDTDKAVHHLEYEEMMKLIANCAG